MFTRFVYHGLTCMVKIGPVCSIYSLFIVFFFVFKKKCFCYLMSSRNSIQLGGFAANRFRKKIKIVFTPRFLPCTSLFVLESTANAILFIPHPLVLLAFLFFLFSFLKSVQHAKGV